MLVVTAVRKANPRNSIASETPGWPVLGAAMLVRVRFRSCACRDGKAGEGALVSFTGSTPAANGKIDLKI
jgi:hypothetical protein